jgi:polyether ionophore transport system permease protein
MSGAVLPSPTPAVMMPSARARFMGLGSIFGKTFRDSRRTALVIGALLILIVVATASQVAIAFETPAKRAAFAFEMSQLPAIFEGMLGTPIAIDRLGGFLSWRVINFFPVLLGIWSTVALSGVLAGEVSRGSMDMLAVGRFARRRIALEKLGGYLLACAVCLLVTALGTYASVVAFAALPGDDVGLGAVLAHYAWLFVTTLVPGAVAFAVAPVLGRGIALATGAIVLIASFSINAYGSIVSALDALKPISYLAFTANHRPMAGQWDWPPIVVLGVIVVALLAAGVLAFERRDLLVPSAGRVSIPPLRVFLGGPLSRGVGERLPAALAWGSGLAIFTLVIASSAQEFVTQLSRIPEILDLLKKVMPSADITSTGGYLQLAIFQEMIVIAGIAGATFLAGWASDENERRLEVVMSAPLTRAGWGVRSALSVMIGIAVMTVLLDLGVLAGAAIAGGEVIRPVVGTLVIGLYAMALAGIGLAVGGLVRPTLAAPVTLIIGLAFFLLDLIGSALRLPDWVLNLALQRHLGHPIVGDFDPAGLILCAAIAVAGVALCAGGMERRDIGR